MFFWSTGFRVTRKYRVMRYKRPADGAEAPLPAATDKEVAAASGGSTLTAGQPL